MKHSRKLVAGLAVIAAGVALAVGIPAKAQPRVGKPAPAFELKTLEGKTVNPTKDKRADLVVFWASW